MKCYIYILRDPITKKIRYVGKTNNIKQRYKNHINKNRDKKTHKRNWINKLREKGKKPIIEIIDEANNTNWKEKEKYWIRYYLDKNCKLVNETNGGDGLSFGNKTSYKKGNGMKKVVVMDNDGCIIDVYPSIKDASLFYGLSEGSVSNVLSKKWKKCKGLIWILYDEYKKMSKDDIREYINWSNSDDRKKNKTSFKKGHSMNSKIIYQYNMNNGKYIKTWTSASQAGRELSINNTSIGNCARGKTKSSGGFYWSYKKMKNFKYESNNN